MVSYVNGAVRVTVKRINGEYRCRLHINERPDVAADYFTSDKADAYATAQHMADRARTVIDLTIEE